MVSYHMYGIVAVINHCIWKVEEEKADWIDKVSVQMTQEQKELIDKEEQMVKVNKIAVVKERQMMDKVQMKQEEVVDKKHKVNTVDMDMNNLQV